MSIKKNHAEESLKIEDRTSSSDTTRDRLLNAAIDVFGRQGFEAATTRAIAAAAEANIQAISYYFGNKEGLYEAAADHLSRVATERGLPVRNRISLYLEDVQRQGRAIEKKEAAELLEDLAGSLLRIFINTETAIWARFITREQMEPTAAFGVLHERLMNPMLVLIGHLIAVLIDEPDPSSRYIRLRALSFIGSLLVFRFGNATLLAHVGNPATDADVATTMHRLVHDLVASLHHDGKTS